MFVLNLTDDYNSFTNCTYDKNDDINSVLECLLLSIPSGVLLLSLIGLIKYTSITFLSIQ